MAAEIPELQNTAGRLRLPVGYPHRLIAGVGGLTDLDWESQFPGLKKAIEVAAEKSQKGHQLVVNYPEGPVSDRGMNKFKDIEQVKLYCPDLIDRINLAGDYKERVELNHLNEVLKLNIEAAYRQFPLYPHF